MVYVSETLANQASKAWFVVKSELSNFGDVKPDILAKIFDCKLLPILLYDQSFGSAMHPKTLK